MRRPKPLQKLISNLDDLPLLLTLDEVAAIYRLQPKTIRNQMFKGTFPVLPFLTHPFRWRRADIAKHLAGPDLLQINYPTRRAASSP